MPHHTILYHIIPYHTTLSPLSSQPNCHTSCPSVNDLIGTTFWQDAGLLIPLAVLEQPSSWCFDIVTPSDTHTACFTKAYSRYAKGTGSVLSTAGWATPQVEAGTSNSTSTRTRTVEAAGAHDEKLTPVGVGGEQGSPTKRPRTDNEEPAGGVVTTSGEMEKEKEKAFAVARSVEGSPQQQGQQQELGQKKCLSEQQIRTLRLRYFSPRELLRLFGFPLGRFSFPAHVSRKKAYELIGNSLNVDVAAQLIYFLMQNTNIPVVVS